MKIRLMTYWKDKELECCCPIKNKCARKNLMCEELEFNLDPFADAEKCMGHESYARVKGSIHQRR